MAGLRSLARDSHLLCVTGLDTEEHLGHVDSSTRCVRRAVHLDAGKYGGGSAATP